MSLTLPIGDFPRCVRAIVTAPFSFASRSALTMSFDAPEWDMPIAALLSQVNLRPVEVFNTDPNESQLGRRRSIFIREITILEKK